MGTHGLVGFIIEGVQRGTSNYLDSCPSALEDAIIKFILALTEEELGEMTFKVEQVCVFSRSPGAPC